MRSNLMKAVIGLLVGLSLVAGLAPSAGADISPDDGTPFPTNSELETIENVGSDTSYFVVCDLAQKFHKNKPAIPNTGVNPGVANVDRDYALCLAGNAATSTVPPAGVNGSGVADCQFNGRNGYIVNPSITVRADVDDDPSGHTYCVDNTIPLAPVICTGGAYVSGNDYAPPNGSSAGVQALADCAENGPIDFARSSRRINTGDVDEQDMQFYAFAMGGLTWSRWKVACASELVLPLGCSPKNLTKTQLRNIYSCAVTNWNQVGGDNAAIIRYAIQPGSGTRSAFDSRILGGGGISMQTGIANSCSPVPAANILQEHDATGLTPADKPAAIYGYDIARWNSQSTGFEVDKRNGASLGKINGVAPTTATLSESEALENDVTACDTNVTPTSFCGSRLIFNVIDTPATSVDAYEATINFVGVRIIAGADNDHNGMVCSNKQAAVISANGFTPLAFIEGGLQTRIDEPSSCRLESVITNVALEAANV